MGNPNEHVIFVDCETTGLDHNQHEMWEVALIDGQTGTSVIYYLDAIKAHAERHTKPDPGAFRVNRFYERVEQIRLERGGKDFWNDPEVTAREIAVLTSRKHLVGACVDFDAGFLRTFLARYTLAPAWHYHLIDVEALAAGKLGLLPPWKSIDLCRALGVETPDEKHAHTAMADALCAKATYEAIYAKPKT
jgi:DNA polymerase III epsilon subunit-like protein